MASTVNITPTAPLEGTAYATDVPLTPTEGVLGDESEVAQEIPTNFGAAIVAVVRLSVTGLITGNSTYIVMQMDVGDDVWVDLNWLVWTASQGSATFVFSNGVAGANTFQQTRASGQVPQPQATGSNQLCLGGRIRFVGKTVMTGGSSTPAGVVAAVKATISYKLLGLR